MQKTFVRGGSVKVFVVVGVILTVLALAALYFVGKNFYADEVPPMVVPEASVDETSKPSDESTETSDEATNQDSSPAEGPAADADKSANSSTNVASDVGSVSSDNDGEPGQGDSENLPQTGPADSLMSSIALASLSVSTAYYIRSVRQLRTS